MVDLTFRGVGPWGPGKGSNLQASEVDNNFWEVAEAIVNLETNPAQPNSIETISLSGTQMYITLSDGTVLGPYTIPVLVMRWRDEWIPDTPYVTLDVFKVTDWGIFLVQVEHVSGPVFDPDITVGGQRALVQLFGSVDAKLTNLQDVYIPAGLHNGDVLVWDTSYNLWVNAYRGSMAEQDKEAVVISGGIITGMPLPTNPADVATKAYVDGAVSGGASIPSLTMMSNISLAANSAAPNTLSDFLDAALGSTIVGNLIMRDATGWEILPPGGLDYVLQSHGSGVPLTWVPPPGAGVVAISAGTGISTGGSPITSSGAVSLASIADSTLLGNASGGTTAPVPLTVSQFLDHALGTARGTILTRNITGWIALAPGTNGYYLKTQGAGADLLWDAPAGAGTVTSVGSGTGLTGGPITGTGSLSLAAIADANVLGNVSGGSAAPAATTATALLDKAFSTTQGAVLYRSNTAWVALGPGISGQILTTAGAAANPSWANAPITASSSPNLRIVANVSGGTAVPTANTLTAILDAIVSSARGTLLYRTNSGWVGLAPGSNGQILQSGGASGDPSWIFAATIQTLDSLVDVSSFGAVSRDILYFNGSNSQWMRTRQKYNIGCYSPGTMTPNQNLLFHRFSVPVTIPANFAAFFAHAVQAGSSTLPTNSTTITFARATDVNPRTFTDVASVTFTSGGLINWSAQAAINFGYGDVLRVRGPATPDPTFADFYLTLVGFET